MEHKIGELLNHAGLSGGGHTQDQLTPALQDATRQIQELVTLTQSNADSARQTTTASTEVPNTSGLSMAENLLGSQGPLGGLLGGGLIGDLFSGLSGLFGGGASQPPPLVPYDAPQSQDFELATGGGQIGDAVYNESGSPQVSSLTEPALSGLQYMRTQSGSAGGQSANRSSDRSAAQTSPQITVQVQAMDSQSFMDRSADIAQAVRQAMLNMHSINDVIGDL